MSSARSDRIYSELNALRDATGPAQKVGLGRALRSSSPNSALIHYLASSSDREAALRSEGRKGGVEREAEKTGIFSEWLEKRWHRE